MSSDIFKTPSGLVLPVTLTDASGAELERASDAPYFYKVTGTNVDSLEFYLDPDGTKYMEVLNISVTASIDVPLDASYIWIVGERERVKTPYNDQLETMDASITCPTAYPGGEPVPYGTVHFVRVEVGEADSGTYDVYVNVMARMGTVPVSDEEEDYPDNLDVTFAGITLSVLSEPEPSINFPFKKTILASGKTYIQTSSEIEYNWTYRCGPALWSEITALIAMAGVSGDLVIDGTIYSNCYIVPPLSRLLLVKGRWSYDITFAQHTSLL